MGRCKVVKKVVRPVRRLPSFKLICNSLLLFPLPPQLLLFGLCHDVSCHLTTPFGYRYDLLMRKKLLDTAAATMKILQIQKTRATLQRQGASEQQVGLKHILIIVTMADTPPEIQADVGAYNP